jgi:diguanylate cyclase (GGDEF)-like protein
MMFSVPPILGGIVQGLFYGTSLTWPSVIVSFVIVYIYVLNRQISTDALTGLNNRRMLKRYLDLETNYADKDSRLFLIMLDADNFKSINDTFGHAAGDRALTQIAEILKALCNQRDCFLSRLGGDEFTIVGKDRDGLMLNEMAEEIEARVKGVQRRPHGALPAGAEQRLGALRTGHGRYDRRAADCRGQEHVCRQAGKKEAGTGGKRRLRAGRGSPRGGRANRRAIAAFRPARVSSPVGFG